MYVCMYCIMYTLFINPHYMFEIKKEKNKLIYIVFGKYKFFFSLLSFLPFIKKCRYFKINRIHRISNAILYANIVSASKSNIAIQFENVPFVKISWKRQKKTVFHKNIIIDNRYKLYA